MSHLATSANSTTLGSVVLLEPRVPKCKQIEELARKAGHALDGNFKCVGCHMKLNMNKNMASLTDTLALKCLGAPDSLPQVILHTRPMADGAEDFQHYIYHGLSVHKSHNMATSGVRKKCTAALVAVRMIELVHTIRSRPAPQSYRRLGNGL